MKEIVGNEEEKIQEKFKQKSWTEIKKVLSYRIE